MIFIVSKRLTHETFTMNYMYLCYIKVETTVKSEAMFAADPMHLDGYIIPEQEYKQKENIKSATFAMDYAYNYVIAMSGF